MCYLLVQNMFLKTDSSSQASQCFLPLPPHKLKHYYSQDQTVSFFTVFESCVSLRWSYHHGAVVPLNCPFMQAGRSVNCLSTVSCGLCLVLFVVRLFLCSSFLSSLSLNPPACHGWLPLPEPGPSGDLFQLKENLFLTPLSPSVWSFGMNGFLSF